jgi:hypothetical protein
LPIKRRPLPEQAAGAGTGFPSANGKRAGVLEDSELAVNAAKMRARLENGSASDLDCLVHPG